MRREAWRLRHEDDVYAEDDGANAANVFHGATQKVHRVRPFERRVLRREVRPDVCKSRTAEDGVRHRVRYEIRIRVPLETVAVIDPHATQHERATLLPGMDVEARRDP